MCLKILLFLTICFVWFSKPVSSENENKANNAIQNINIEPRIIGGYRPTNGSLAKYVVSIRFRYEGEYNFGELHFCAGIILTSKKILTAAHCVYKNRYLLKIVAKTPKRLEINKNTQTVSVQNMIVHPDFDPDKKINDIAVLILKDNIKLDNKSASSIALPKADVVSGELCQVAGWGRLYEHGPSANKILHTSFNVHTSNQCLQISLDAPGTRFCGSYYFDETMDACMGDSGGPLVCKGEVTGIVSFGYGCGWAASGVYTNVYSYLNWIKRNGQTVFKPSLVTIGVNLIIIIIALK